MVRLAAAVIIGLLWAAPSAAQQISIDFGDQSSFATRAVQLFLLVTLLGILPGLVIMVTCFPFLVTVLAILRQAIGLPQSPPNMLIVSLALFLTYYVMEPVFLDAWETGLEPLMDGRLQAEAALGAIIAPFEVFMADRVDPATLLAFLDMRGAEAPRDDPPLSVLVPSFMVSELSRAFQIGFLVFLPFLVIDLVVAAVLMSMGMMMVPPAIVALPFKLAFFVVADGWTLIAAALVRSYTG